MTSPDTPTTNSSRQFNFERLASQTQPLHELITIDDMMHASKKASDPWGAPSYQVPLTYFRAKKGDDKTTEKKKENVVDGPAFSVGKAQRGRFFHLNSYGKDGNAPPHSYLQTKEWSKKKEAKVSDEKKKEINRNTYIDKIYFNEKKYNFPGPGVYFKEAPKKEAKKAEGSGEKKKPPERLNFLCDAEYLGMNNPAPGTYTLTDGWTKLGKKSAAKEGEKKDKAKYVPGSWRPKNDQPRGPGQYEITRVMSVEADAKKGRKEFKSIPVFKRTTLGLINKAPSEKPRLEKIPTKTGPGSYFAQIADMNTAYKKIAKPMRKY